MASKNSYYYFKEHNFSATEILETLDIPYTTEDLQISFSADGDSIHITGPSTDYTIKFFKAFYTVTKKFQTYEVVEHRSYQNNIIKSETDFYIDDDTLVFEENNTNDPSIIDRSMYLLRKGADKKKATLTKEIVYYPESGYLETYTKGLGAFSTSSKHRIRMAPNNVIISNTENFAAIHNEGVLHCKSISTCSTKGSSAACELDLPDSAQIEELQNYGMPTILIDGLFLDIKSSDEKSTAPKLLTYRFFTFKRDGTLSLGITFNDGAKKQEFLRAYQTDKDPYMTVKDLGILVDKMQEEKFLDLGTDYPLEMRILTDLMKLRIDLYTNVISPSKGIDFLDFNLTDPKDYNHMAFEIYENLRRYYEECLKLSNVNKGQKKEV